MLSLCLLGIFSWCKGFCHKTESSLFPVLLIPIFDDFLKGPSGIKRVPERPGSENSVSLS